MASVYADPRLRNKRSYIAVGAFDGSFKEYVVTKNLSTNVTTGSLVAVAGATASNCPQGRILREVGKRLYPDAHPGITTMMVRVYDANSGLSGFIDPNAPLFAVFNSDKPVEIVDGGDDNGATPHKGQPVFTTGDIITSGGDITAQTGDITATAGNIVASSGYIAGTVSLGSVSSGPVYSGIVTDGGSGNINVSADATTANSFVATFNTGGIAATKIVYVYFGPGATQVAPPAGTMVSLVLVNNSGNAINVTFNNVTPNIIVGNLNIGTNGFLNGTCRAWNFVSDGANLYLVGSATY